MFESLGDRLSGVFDRLRGRGALTEADVRAAMREVRIALLEADVALPVVRTFVDKATEEAVGQQVLRSVTPGQQVVKIVHDALVEMLGSEEEGLNLAVTPPAVVMMVGLQGSGKTTSTAKLAKRLTEKDRKKVLMASLDVARPAAQEQLAVLGRQADIATLPIVPGQPPVEIARRALKWTIYLLIAFWTGGAWIMYFADAPTLTHDFWTGQAAPVAYATVAILTATTFLLGGFMREELRFPLDLTGSVLNIDPARLGEPGAVQALDAAGLKDALDLSARKALGDRAGNELASTAWREVAARLVAHPALLDTRFEVSVPVSDALAKAIRGEGNPQLTALAGQLRQRGSLHRALDTGFLTRSDATSPQQAGIWGALKGSILTMLVTLGVAFPIGVASAISTAA